MTKLVRVSNGGGAQGAVFVRALGPGHSVSGIHPKREAQLKSPSEIMVSVHAPEVGGRVPEFP